MSVQGIHRERDLIGRATGRADGREPAGLVVRVGRDRARVVGAGQEVAVAVVVEVDRCSDGLADDLVGPVIGVVGGRSAFDLLGPVAVEVVLVGGSDRESTRAGQAGQSVVAEALGARAGVTGDPGQAPAIGRDPAGAIERLAD